MSIQNIGLQGLDDAMNDLAEGWRVIQVMPQHNAGYSIICEKEIERDDS